MYNQEQRQRTASRDSINTLDQIHLNKMQVERQIRQNNQEIRMLNNKIVKSDYDHSNLIRLNKKQAILADKQKELDYTIKNHQFLQKEIQSNKLHQNQFKHYLGSQYQHISQEKKQRFQDEKRQNIAQERIMHDYNKKMLEDEYIRKKQVMEQQKRVALEELAYRDHIKQKEKEDRNREKDEYNQKVQMRNQLETQKDSVYKQYYHHFMEEQDKLQNIYKNKAAVYDNERYQHRNQVEKKQIDDFQNKQNREHQEKVMKIQHDRDELRNYLQSQMQENNSRKQRKKEDEQNYQSQVLRYQVNAKEMEQSEKQKRREEQRRYEQDLNIQTRTRSYNGNYPIADQGSRIPHNPITNPIDFKIGITNPYVIREYENTKEKHTGQNQLKLRNLALVGNSSLLSQ